MRSARHRFLSWFLLAIYAGIALLGEGLHSLVPEGERHHHHHGLYIISHVWSDACHQHDAAARDASTHASLTAADCDADSHLCEICAFLFQAISQPAEVAAPIEWEPLIAPAHAAPQPLYWLASLGPQAARGPPLLTA
jgi:hypothetical protein